MRNFHFSNSRFSVHIFFLRLKQFSYRVTDHQQIFIFSQTFPCKLVACVIDGKNQRFFAGANWQRAKINRSKCEISRRILENWKCRWLE